MINARGIVTTVLLAASVIVIMAVTVGPPSCSKSPTPASWDASAGKRH